MRSGRKNVHAGVNAASMTDIAYLLLVFFLVTTIFAVEKGIPVLLPANDGAIGVKREHVATVMAHADGAITLDGFTVSLAQLRLGIEQRLAIDKNLVVVIESHPDCEYGVMIDVLDELRLAKANRISLREMAAD